MIMMLMMKWTPIYSGRFSMKRATLSPCLKPALHTILVVIMTIMTLVMIMIDDDFTDDKESVSQLVAGVTTPYFQNFCLKACIPILLGQKCCN